MSFLNVLGGILKPVEGITKSVTSVFYDPSAKKYSSKRIAKLAGAGVLIPSGIAMINAGLVKLDINLKVGVVHASVGVIVLLAGVFMGSLGAKSIEKVVTSDPKEKA